MADKKLADELARMIHSSVERWEPPEHVDPALTDRFYRRTLSLLDELREADDHNDYKAILERASTGNIEVIETDGKRGLALKSPSLEFDAKGQPVTVLLSFPKKSNDDHTVVRVAVLDRETGQQCPAMNVKLTEPSGEGSRKSSRKKGHVDLSLKAVGDYSIIVAQNSKSLADIQVTLRSTYLKKGG